MTRRKTTQPGRLWSTCGRTGRSRRRARRRLSCPAGVAYQSPANRIDIGGDNVDDDDDDVDCK